MAKKRSKKQVLLLDLYGVIIRESKGNFIPYTFAHFGEKEYARLEHAFRDERLFTKCQNGEMSSDEFLSRLGYENPARAMRDYLEHFVTLDTDFLSFAEQYHTRYDFVLLSNDVKEWNRYLFDFYGLHRYFHDCIVSGDISLRKPDPALFAYALSRTRRSSEPQTCILVDNSTANLDAAKAFGIRTILFNRDHVPYDGRAVNSFSELARCLDSGNFEKPKSNEL